ncbi:MAG: MOSC domain-containing protein [Nitrospira sp.]|nr:MOSC domain-containing protein [Nitrospira sp.]
MSIAHPLDTGTVAALWRYPVKSMQGEELTAADITLRGMAGDRGYAVIDAETGKVASAKNPKKWGRLFDCRALLASAHNHGGADPVEVLLPDGNWVTAGAPETDARLSALLGRPVRLAGAVPAAPQLEEYWPDIPGRARQNTVTDESMPAGTFFDGALIHLITTATLDALRRLYPDGRFEMRRFRPNLVLAYPSNEPRFVENDWINRTLRIGNDLRLKVTGPCARCVMTTLPQGDLPEDAGILRTAVQHNHAAVGVYATILSPGRISRGDRIQLV